MFSSRAFPRLARVLGTARPFAVIAAAPRSGNWRWQSALGLVAAGALLTWDAKKTRADDPVVDVPVCKLSDLAPGVLKQVQIGENKDNFIVVTKIGDTVYAVSGKCPHFGAPLATGYLDGFHLLCPWHCAGFDVRSGEIYGAPGVNSLTTYTTKVAENGDVVVSIPESKLSQVAASRPSPRLTKPDGSDPRTFVVVGGGAAGHACVESLRRNGFKGRIVLLTEEDSLPYDRVLLSKNLKSDASAFTLRQADFYEEYGVEVRLSTAVKSIDSARRSVKTAAGDEIVSAIQNYDKLCLASGARARVPRPFSPAVSHLGGVFTIRSARDHTALRSALEAAQNVVIIGGSFLGLETATAIRRAFPNKTVTIVDVEEKPLQGVFGPEISRQLIDLQRNNGVAVHAGVGIKSINEHDGKVSGVTIETKSEFKSPTISELPAQVVVVATGAQINTGFVPYQLLNKDQSVRVDAFLRSDDPHIFAAGDIASYHSYLTETSERVEHWAVAQDQGRVAGENMLGLGQLYGVVPFFWSNQFANVQFAGYSRGADWSFTETDSENEPSKTARITYFFKGEKCIGVAAINRPGAIVKLRLALTRGLMPNRHELVSGKVRYPQIAASVDATKGGKWGPQRRRGCCQAQK